MKRNLTCLLCSVVVMLGLPWLAVTFAPGDAGMAICFLLFYAIDPLCSIMMGIFAGMDLRKLWYQPFLTPLLFLAGAWLLFDIRDPVLQRYALVYLGFGIAAMLITLGIRKIAL